MKRQKQESTKQKEVKSAEKAQPDIFSDIPIQPVDDILSVKKVKIRPENKDNKAEGIIAKEQENMQREMIFDETGIQSVKKVERAAVKASKTEEAEKKAEDKDDTIASEAKAIESEKEKSKKADVKSLLLLKRKFLRRNPLRNRSGRLKNLRKKPPEKAGSAKLPKKLTENSVIAEIKFSFRMNPKQKVLISSKLSVRWIPNPKMAENKANVRWTQGPKMLVSDRVIQAP